MTTICICGGGNLGHIIAGIAASRPDKYCVNILTKRPNLWQKHIEIELPTGEFRGGQINIVSEKEADVIPQADIILLCLPGYLIQETLNNISKEVNPSAAIGSIVASTGFFFEAMKIDSIKNNPLFGFQRVPFIARTIKYGSRGAILGYKKSVNIAIERSKDKEILHTEIEELIETKTILLNSFYEPSLTNSNPLLHTARLYSLFHDYQEGSIYPKETLFYKEWNDYSSEIYIAMDHEFQKLLEVLPIKKGSIPDVLTYYESHDASSLTVKIRSIEAFKGIMTPMKTKGEGYIPDFKSRYFTEDFPYGLKIIYDLCHKYNIHSPIINKVYLWGMQHI